MDPDHVEAQKLHRRMKRAGAALERGRAAAMKREFEAGAYSRPLFS